MNDKDFEMMQTHSMVHYQYLGYLESTIIHLREYLDVMSTEPDELIPLSKVYHDLRRILGDES